MKLRIHRNSLRLRITQPDMEKLIDSGRIEEELYFAPGEKDRLVYALSHQADRTSPMLLYKASNIEVALPSDIVREWAETEQVGIYFSVDLGTRGFLDLIVEKDFACLDAGGDEVTGAFPNPNVGTVC